MIDSVLSLLTSDFHENWGTEDLKFLSRHDGLHAIRINALGAYALGNAGHVPPAVTTAPSMKVLPKHEVVALVELPLSDGMTLSAFGCLTPTCLTPTRRPPRSIEAQPSPPLWPVEIDEPVSLREQLPGGVSVASVGA